MPPVAEEDAKEEIPVKFTPALALAALLVAPAAHAEIKVGAILSLTGPAASLGIPAKNAIDILPRKIGSETVTYTILDDASDPTAAVRAARKLIDEEKVDVIFGPSITPTSLALLEVVAPAKTPMISLAGSAIIAAPVEGNKTWAFKLAPEEPTMDYYLAKDMEKQGLKSLAFIGFNDSFGDSFIGAMKKVAADKGFKVLGDERYNRNDTSVTGQVLRLISTNPDAIVVGSSGTPGVAPILEMKKLGYRGQIYINQGMASTDVLRVGGADLDGVKLAVSPVLVAEQLPAANVVKPAALKFVAAYEGKYGQDSRSLFAATAWDAFVLVEDVMPKVLADAKPGTPEFRTALRDALQNLKDAVASQGVFTMSATNHNGTDLRAETLVEIKGGKWKYVPLD